MAQTMHAAHELEKIVLAQGAQLAPFWLFYGDDPFLQIESQDTFRRLLKTQGFEDRETVEPNATSDWYDMTMAAAGMGMFCSLKLVEVKPTADKPSPKGQETLLEYLNHPVDGVVTAFFIKAQDWQNQKKEWYQALMNKCVVFNCQPLTIQQLPAWLRARLQKHQLDAEPAALEYLAEQVEGNSHAAAQEVEKLALLMPRDHVITLEDVHHAVMNASHYELETLFDSIDNRDVLRVSRIIEGLEAQSMPMPSLLAMLTAHVRGLLKLRMAYDNGENIRYVKGVFATDAMRAAAKRLNTTKLMNALQVLSQIDEISKGMLVEARNDNPWLELKGICLFLAK